MADKPVRETGSIEDIDGLRLSIGVDHDAVTIGGFRFMAAERVNPLIGLICDAWHEALKYAERYGSDDD
jgi:hypothetical protein